MLCLVTVLAMSLTVVSAPAEPDLILHHGKIISVDPKFSVYEALAVKSGRILKVGSSVEVLRMKGPETHVVDLHQKSVLPGLMDSHVHPADACLTEFDHAILEMETIGEVLKYVASRAKSVREGEWIQLGQIFITRLQEQRY